MNKIKNNKTKEYIYSAKNNFYMKNIEEEEITCLNLSY